MDVYMSTKRGRPVGSGPCGLGAETCRARFPATLFAFINKEAAQRGVTPSSILRLAVAKAHEYAWLPAPEVPVPAPPVGRRQRHRQMGAVLLAARRRINRGVRRQLARAILGGKCAKCGATGKLDIDHIDRTTKRFDVLTDMNRKPADFLCELKKCQLLCPEPCHRGHVKASHGSERMYKARRCRCDTCCSGHVARLRALRARRKELEKELGYSS